MRVRISRCLLAIIVLPTVCLAQGYPAKPIRIIVPYAPGGSTDVVIRTIAPRLGEELGQTIVVDNRPGGTSTIGLDLAAKSAPDGYTWGISNIAYGANPSMIKPMPFDAEKDLIPVSQISVVSLVLSVHPSIPAKSVKDLIGLAKAKPGELNFGSAGNASANHLAMALFMQRTGANFVHIPYKGGGPAVVSLLGNETAMLFATIPSALQYIQAGRLRALAVSRAQRSKTLPDVPTVAESGVPGYEAIEWNGAMVPAGTASSVVNRIHQAIVATLATPGMTERLAAFGAESVGSSPQQFAEFIKSELSTWSRVVRETGITAN
ncbi:MAG: tripartite tricarboxylate transporter substrate binding protein [Proteobacteria bacterium]|nr:tripartite tricarboxylate transporter substrate binding protein [Burkholderiales bacterium]